MARMLKKVTLTIQRDVFASSTYTQFFLVSVSPYAVLNVRKKPKNLNWQEKDLLERWIWSSFSRIWDSLMKHLRIFWITISIESCKVRLSGLLMIAIKRRNNTYMFLLQLPQMIKVQISFNSIVKWTIRRNTKTNLSWNQSKKSLNPKKSPSSRKM